MTEQISKTVKEPSLASKLHKIEIPVEPMYTYFIQYSSIHS